MDVVRACVRGADEVVRDEALSHDQLRGDGLVLIRNDSGGQIVYADTTGEEAKGLEGSVRERWSARIQPGG